MINVTIYKDELEQYKGFQFKGHAEYAKYGQDIVCAAVSVLVINTVNSIEQFTSDKFSIKNDDGFIKLLFLSSISSECKLFMDSLVLGLNGIVSDYGTKYLNIIVKEV